VNGKGKEKRMTSSKKDEGEISYCNHYERKLMMTIIFGNSTWKRDQRSMEEKASRG